VYRIAAGSPPGRCGFQVQARRSDFVSFQGSKVCTDAGRAM
jgi:hypothetical protein